MVDEFVYAPAPHKRELLSVKFIPREEKDDNSEDGEEVHTLTPKGGVVCFYYRIAHRY